ncbi:hypothetical protein LTR47_003759 [Exophiala xenobiotica]|nr:hypothetical protein LTR47_003759 [Exophiala xenobiotica]KAK5251927.1 hypothetical protein LTS06_003439 [Exophiala xenobiotica]KAK5261585.1 hypothetical protein LTR40_001933 [Exophiala xenobiotica]KAK5346810.1 hypothetical protein LTR61_009506 [Exophiala xenobiotica]KAK5368839.1 hypothetical protein LTS13_007574 [Exophiala xenobiotica]
MHPSKPSTRDSSTSDRARSHFATLEPRIKNISQSTIQKRWKPLPTNSQDKIRQILLNVKTKRCGSTARIPPLGKAPRKRFAAKASSKTQVKEEEYDQIVEEIADKLISRLPRMPFPPAPSTQSQDDTPFDLSNTLHRISSLQATLNTDTSSSHLLRRQIKREQRLLKRDRAELDALETGLKSSKELRRRKERGLHPIAQQLDFVVDDDNNNDDDEHAHEIERVNSITGISMDNSAKDTTEYNARGGRSATMTTSLDEEGGGEELDSLLKQLRSHLSSMRNNTVSMRPVLQAMDETKVALDGFAVRKLGHGALGRIYGVRG